MENRSLGAGWHESSELADASPAPPRTKLMSTGEQFRETANSNTVLLFLLFALLSRAAALDLSHAVVVSPANASGPERQAAQMLVEEVQKRTHIRWAIQSAWPSSDAPMIALGKLVPQPAWPEHYTKQLRLNPNPNAAEGFQIQVVANNSPPAVLVMGNDVRGEMFGVGQLLRALHLTPERVLLDDG